MVTLNNEQLKKITQAVAQVEQSTSGEIVPMIVKSSGVYNYVLWILTLAWLLVLELCFFEAVVLGFVEAYPWYHLVVLIVAAALAWVSAKIDWVFRWIADDDEMELNCQRRAEVEFYRHGFHKTERSTGILLFVSLAEHRAVVLADRAISDKMPKDTWSQVVERLISGVRQEDLSRGVCEAVTLCGEILAKHFPKQAADKNELPDTLIVKE